MTTFRVYLPAQAISVVGVGTSALIDLPRENDELILVIDDEFALRQITQQTLEAFGCRVLLASDGAEAVAIFAVQVNEIAAVITDMMMTVMDGAATIQALIRMQLDVSIIAAGGLSANGLMSEAVISGVRHECQFSARVSAIPEVNLTRLRVEGEDVEKGLGNDVEVQ